MFTMRKNAGAITALAVVFGGAFLMFSSGVISVILLQNKHSLQKTAWQEAMGIAEAGLDYYKWHLAKNPSDFCDGQLPGTGNCQNNPYGPFVHEYKDPEGSLRGGFSLSISPSTGCEAAMEITSTGWTARMPGVKRTVRIKYAKSALAKYAFLTDSNVWFASYENLKGLFHSNGGIRMDGTQNSLSTSAKENYICSEEHGCSPPQEKPGIWGSGQGQSQGFWQFPAPSIDFDLITRDLAALKADAQDFGIYISQPTDHGFHLKFKSDGTLDVFRVKKLKQKVWGWDGKDWIFDSNDIDTEEFFASYSLPDSCAPIFVENNVWVEGTVKGRATVVAAKLPESQNNMRKIIIGGNIDYQDSNSVLGLIGQSDILIPLYSLDDLRIKAAMISQKGHIMRYYYPRWSADPYRTYAVRNNISTQGSIISKGLWTFTWTDGADNVVSGYRTTEMNYDSGLTYDPPPYFPVVGDYQFGSWEEL